MKINSGVPMEQIRSKQCELMPNVKLMEEGLKDAFAWYLDNQDKVTKKDYIKYIDENSYKRRR